MLTVHRHAQDAGVSAAVRSRPFLLKMFFVRIGSDKEKIATVIWKLGPLLLINIKQRINRHRMVKRNSSNHYIVHSWYIINPVLKILSVTGKGMNTSLQ